MFTSRRGLSVERFAPEHGVHWGRFLESAKNATFMFERAYMDYHADRFSDHSLLISRAGELVALLPANERDDRSVCSHQGLTFGGFVFKRDVSLLTVLEVVSATLEYLHALGIGQLVYKRIPRFYNTLPDDEIDYAMFLLGASLARRDCAFVVAQSDRLPIRRGKKSQISKGRRAGLRVEEERDFAPYWQRVLEPRLRTRYGVRPVHTLEEITLLASRFPEHIRQFSVYCGDAILAGITIFETPTVAHVQYSAIAPEGEPVSALDFLGDWLIAERYKDKRYFDFGIANEREGRAINASLLQSKEGFGARCASHDFYEIDTAGFSELDGVLPALATDAAGSA